MQLKPNCHCEKHSDEAIQKAVILKSFQHRMVIATALAIAEQAQ